VSPSTTHDALDPRPQRVKLALIRSARVAVGPIGGRIDGSSSAPTSASAAISKALRASRLRLPAAWLRRRGQNDVSPIAPGMTHTHWGCKSGTARASVRFASKTGLQNREMNMVDETPNTVERTTIIETGNGNGGGGMLAVVLLILVILGLLFLFRDQLGFGGDTTEVSIPDKIEVNVN